MANSEEDEIKVEIKIEDFEKYVQDSIDVALEMIGIKAESYAKIIITENGSVDTGLLRNSIAHAVSGEVPQIGQTYGIKRELHIRSYKANRKKGKEKAVREGTYTRQTPKAQKNSKYVYVGSNVEYAPDVELGHRQKNGKFTKPKPFLKPAMINHREEWEQILKDNVQEAVQDFEDDN